jgi:hypothetical protein
MKRVSLFLVALLVVAATGSIAERRAAAKGPVPEVTHASAVLALVGGETGRPKLVWLNPLTLKRVGPTVAKLSGDVFSPVLSPTGGRVAVGGAGTGIRIANVSSAKLSPPIARRGAAWDIAPIAWPDDGRVIALEWHDQLPRLALVVVDPAARRVLKRTVLDGYVCLDAAGGDVVLVAGPPDGIGPARVLVIDRSGTVRSVVLARIGAGNVQEGSGEDPTYRTASPGVAVDPDGHRAFVVGEGTLLAEIDLDTLAVSYRDLAPTKIRHSRLEPAVEAKNLVGWSRHAVWLGGGLLATAGTDYDALRSTPVGADVIDVEGGAVRTLEPSASLTLSDQGIVLAGGGGQDGQAGTDAGIGVSAFAPDGTRLWHALGSEPVWWVQASGGYAYVAGPDPYPATVRVIDLATGAVRTLHSHMPVFVTRHVEG